jgi:uncharacterized protein
MRRDRRVFADTNFWVALLVPGDQWRQRAIEVTRELGPIHIVTTQEVLLELLGFVAGRGDWVRSQVAEWVEQALTDPDMTVLPQSDASFRAGLALYRERPDKSYSLTDCVSMAVMRAQGITDVLTHDHHFQQEGFVALLR